MITVCCVGLVEGTANACPCWGGGGGAGTAEPDDKASTQHDVCIVGAGLSAAVLAERHSTTFNHSVLVIEKRDHIGGNCFDYIDKETGIRRA